MRLRQLPVVDPHRERIALGRGLRAEGGEADAVVPAQGVARVDDRASRRPARGCTRQRRQRDEDGERERRERRERAGGRCGAARPAHILDSSDLLSSPASWSLREHRARAERRQRRRARGAPRAAGPAARRARRVRRLRRRRRRDASPCRITFARPSFPSSPRASACTGRCGSEFNAAAALAADAALRQSRARVAICTTRAALDGVQALGRRRADARRRMRHRLERRRAGRSRRRRRSLRRLHRRRPPPRLRRRLLRPLARRASARRARSASPGRSPRSTSPTFAARPHDIPLAFVVTERGVR